MNTIINDTCHPALRTLLEDLLDPKSSAIRLAKLLDTPDILAEDKVFLAYCESGNIGAKNDWDGKRSNAQRIKRDWEFHVLHPAQIMRLRK
jgi:hypothetical protein